MRKRVFLSPPHMGGGEMEFIKEAFARNYIAPLGENVTGFEEDIKAFTGAENALALSSGTAALHLALLSLGIKAGDRVMASSLTFIGSVSPITFIGAEPIFIDSDKKSWNLDPNLLEDAVRRERPKALILTHLYGCCADLEAIGRICDQWGVVLIEDAAESLGAVYKERQSGTIGAAGIYSFNGNKIITTSGGGMLVSQSEAVARRASFLSTQAREPVAHYEHNEIGFNYRMSNILAGIGRGQMRVLSDRVRRRREIFSFYRSALNDLPIEFMPEISGSRSNRWLSAILLNDSRVTTEAARLALERKNIESRPLWKPMHAQGAFSGAKRYVTGVSEDLFARGLCLPSGSQMNEDDLWLTAETIRNIFR
ncbi:MAG: aminotransferase class V-fold PLP-dependent enzyme [Helicobacteraceae bacterium]|nr:aminotransferase class V-fold PLP-dependent enzyme [Helicobacteraceae bacterium]